VINRNRKTGEEGRAPLTFGSKCPLTTELRQFGLLSPRFAENGDWGNAITAVILFAPYRAGHTYFAENGHKRQSGGIDNLAKQYPEADEIQG
jgi:hypothetical protein